MNPGHDPIPSVLIVDDHDVTRNCLRELLSEALPACDIRVAEGGEEALHIVRTDAPQLVLMDINMPGMNGLEATRRIKAMAPRTHVVICTFSDAPAHQAAAIEAGACAYVTKDNLDAELARIVRLMQHGCDETDGGQNGRRTRAMVDSHGDDQGAGDVDQFLMLPEDYLSQVWANVEAVYYWMGPDARFLYVNDTACRSLGYSRDELLNMTVHDIDPNFPKEAWQQHWKELRQEGSMVVETVHRTKDGREFPVEVSLSCQTSGDEERNCAFARDITERKQAEARRALEAQVLATLNRPNDWQNLLRDLLVGIKDFTGLDAVGLRLRENEDFPYYEWNGFSEEFVAQERHLCARDEAGEVIRDSAGNTCLECLCGNVIQGRTDPTLPCFTEEGSFWTNSTSLLLAEVGELDLQGQARNRCNSAGYESVALIPLRAGGETIGLLQFNDRQKDRFTIDLIQFFEEVGHSIGIACTRKNTREALRESERRLTTLMENLPGMAYRCGNRRNWPMEFVSKGGGDLTGYTPEELTSEKEPAYGDLIHPEDRQMVWDTVQEAIDQGEPFVIEYRLRDKCGAEHWAWEQGQGVAADSSGTAVLEGFICDITKRKQAEEHRRAMEAQLQQSQKLESIGTLAGGVAHEINNPINGIMNYAQLIKDGLDSKGEVLKEFAEEIIHETERVATIVKSLLQFARQGEQGHSPARLADIVDGTSSLIRTVMRHDQITLNIDVPEALPQVRCRSQQIQQVLMNLLTNARDALNERYAGHDPDKIINVSARVIEDDGKTWVRTSVEDHGNGIPDQVRQRIFDPFFTTKAKGQGTGLGLAIAHGIIQDHGGRLQVESAAGEYTRFDIDLEAL